MTGRTLKTAFLAVLCLALLLSAQVAEAKGPPDKATIRGPGLAAPIEITDQTQLLDFSFFMFEDINARIPAPKIAGEGYVITRYIKDGAALIEWDRLIYYPDVSDEPGYVFYAGLVQPGMSTEFDGYWYRVSAAGDAAMIKLLAAALPAAPDEPKPMPSDKVTSPEQPARQAPAPDPANVAPQAQQPADPLASLVPLAVVGGLIVFVGLGAALLIFARRAPGRSRPVEGPSV